MDQKNTDYDVVIIGAGISGINGGYRLQTQVENCNYTILEARDGMGGTWDLFKYPGIRSDSDLHTFGFAFRPWSEQKAIADGESIVNYIKETASLYGIDKRIQYRHKVLKTSWSTDQQRWTVQAEHDGKKKVIHAKFILWSSGYYDYHNPLPVDIPGLKNFKGTIIHPQFWPTDLQYENKKMIVIGSGATAITLLPNLAKKAAHVTMLQRSPTYIINLPQVDLMGWLVAKIFPAWVAHQFVRIKFLIIPWLFFNFCRAYPNAARWILRKRTTRELPKTVPHDPHFDPSYNPWEQRLCVAPDGDIFKALHTGKCSVATGHIDTVTEDGILLKSGEKIDADIIVTATGLKIQLGGGAKIEVDGKPFNWHEKFLWKGVMLQDLPNAAYVIGYTNASWTLGADATAQFVARLINYMKANGMTSCAPRVSPDEKLKDMPVLNLNSTYVTKAGNVLPRAGDRGPWKARANYFTDIFQAKFGDITTGMQFYRVSH